MSTTFFATDSTTEDVAGDGSDRLIDALVLHGTPEEIRAGLVRHLNEGANHVSVQVLVGSGGEPYARLSQTCRDLILTRKFGLAGRLMFV